MKNYLKAYCTFLLLVFLSAQVNGQNHALQKADYEFDQKNYAKAEHFYEKAMSAVRIDEKPEILKKIAECNQQMNQYEKAIEYYEEYLVQAKTPEYGPLFNLGALYLKTGQVQKAKGQFENLLLLKPDDKELVLMIASCDFAANELQKKELPSVINQEGINSEQSEFGLAWLDGKLVFASKRLASNMASIHGRTNQGFSDFYVASYDPVYNLYINPEDMDGDANSPYNDGTLAHDANSNIVYFTQCKKVPERCQIYKGNYQDEEIIDVSLFSFPMPEYDYAHPTITTDGKTMYFVSDMPGGFGGQDLWKATITANGGVKDVKNLGASINTNKNEMFPFIYADSILLFSSEGHVGMGGLDIFYSTINKGLYSKPVNLGAPINSTSDDFSILLNQGQPGGLFCSNRENEEKSDDIYSFNHNIFSADLVGTVNDSLKLAPVPEAKITYYTNSEVVFIVYSDVEGKFTLPLAAHPNCNKEHKLVVEKDGYLTKTQKVACNNPEELVVLLNKKRDNNFAGTVTDRNNGTPLNRVMLTVSSVKGVTDTLFSKPDGSWESDKVNPNDYYNIRASVDGYLSESKNILVPEEAPQGVLSAANGFDTDFRLYPIQLKKEFKIDNIYYEFDKANLLDESKVELGNLVNILNENPNITIRINSHTDERGSLRYNQRLSNERGRSVVTFLVDQGIDKERLFSKGFGETTLLIAKAKTEEEHQLNRRTTFEIMGTTFNADIVNAGMEKEKEIKQKYKNQASTTTKPKEAKPIVKGNYGIQLHATSQPVDVDAEMGDISDLINKYGLKMNLVNSMYKYQLGPVGTREDANKVKELLAQRGYKGCFLIVMEK